ncbi:hypothetical protein ACIP23_27910, partial [Streptomyces sp. NPDC089733]|uniref:hypothetical protein n=1 Tax=Streptomyces sp. NPDC089733 TaxID=3365918 RepID=UPI0037F9A765
MTYSAPADRTAPTAWRGPALQDSGNGPIRATEADRPAELGSGGEIARWRQRVDEPGRERKAPARRFDALTSRLPATGGWR